MSGPYGSPITVNRFPQKISYVETHEIMDSLSINMLRELGIADDEKFCVCESDNFFGLDTLAVTKHRLESQEEMDKRIEREERYMARYTAIKSGERTLKEILAEDMERIKKKKEAKK